MALRLEANSPDFERRFAEVLSMKREISEDVDTAVRTIIEDVAKRGDAALSDYTRRFDNLALDVSGMAFSAEDIDSAIGKCDADALAALQLAAERIRSYHVLQIPQDHLSTDEVGVTSGWRWTALQSVGLYVPGGTASYPSSVLMNAIPAKVAGVERIVMVVPTPRGEVNPLVLAAARLAGVEEIYRVGGAQAVAALAYGTQTIRPVAKIVGPGNAYVAAAKRRVFGQVGIDMIAGPSEVLIIADGEANPDWVAIDLLAQAEHDVAAQSILITDSRELADRVEVCVEAHLKTLPRERIARESWRNYGVVIVVDNIEHAVELSNRVAPEHLEIECRNADELSLGVRNAGALFLGRHTPEAIGDYVGGPNHVLPTARSARFSSGLGVLDFMKRTSILKCDRNALTVLGPAAIALGKSEGLDAHARSVSIRMN